MGFGVAGKQQGVKSIFLVSSWSTWRHFSRKIITKKLILVLGIYHIGAKQLKTVMKDKTVFSKYFETSFVGVSRSAFTQVVTLPGGVTLWTLWTTPTMWPWTVFQRQKWLISTYNTAGTLPFWNPKYYYLFSIICHEKNILAYASSPTSSVTARCMRRKGEMTRAIIAFGARLFPFSPRQDCTRA